MTPSDAAKLLEIAPDATPEQLEARFLELRARFEDKIAKAPTPGLKAKYRESLEQITEAFESLALAADSSALPVINRSEPAPSHATPPAPKPSHAAASAQPTKPTAPKKKSGGGKEFIVVAVVAVILLIGGGWFVMKVRADSAEKARIAAEEKQRADEIQAQQEQLAVQMRTELAEAKIIWEVAEREERDAEKRVSELRSELRNLRDPKPEQLAPLNLRIESAQNYSNWLRDYLLQHPLKLTRAKLEELLQAKAYDTMETTRGELQHTLKELRDTLALSRNGEGMLDLQTNLPTLRWTLKDELDRVVQQGMGPTRISGLAFVRHELEVRAYNITLDNKFSLVEPGKANVIQLDYNYNTIPLKDVPADARLFLGDVPADRLPDGSIPTVGPTTVTAYRNGYLPTAKTWEGSDSPLEFVWIPLNATGLVAGYLKHYGGDSPYQQTRRIVELNKALLGTTLVTPEKWAELYRNLLKESDQEADVSKRLNALLLIADSADAYDEPTSRAALKQAADLITETGVTKGVSVYRSQSAAWRWEPEAGKRFFAVFENAGSKFDSYKGYLYANAMPDAERVRKAMIAEKKADEVENASNWYESTRKQVEFDCQFRSPLNHALTRNDPVAYAKLAKEGIWQEGAANMTIAMDLWRHGLQAQALTLMSANNDTWVPDLLKKGLLLSGRIDLLERHVTAMRKENPNFNYAETALYYARIGNRTKTRAMLDLRDNAEIADISELSTRALAYELIGDRDASKTELDTLEAHKDFNEKTWLSSVSHAIFALHHQSDEDRLKRLYEKLNKKPKDMARNNDWLLSGNVGRAVHALLSNTENAARVYEEAYRNFYRDLSLTPSLKLQDPPVWDRDDAMAGMILAHLDMIYRFGRTNRDYPDMHAQYVHPIMKKRAPFYYPRGATLKEGKAEIEITVNAEGNPVSATTVYSDDPTFAPELIRSMAAWTLFPALKMGTPTEGTYKFTGRFTAPK